jgi:hypothetical protein
MTTIRQQLSEYQVDVKQPDMNDPTTPEVEDSLTTVLAGVEKLATAMGGKSAFCLRLKGVHVFLQPMHYGGIGKAHSVKLNQAGFDAWTVVHEHAHAWDGVDGWDHSRAMQKTVGAGYRDFIARFLHIFRPDNPEYWYLPGNSPPPCGIDRNFNAKEDFAEAVTAFVFPNMAKQRAVDRGWPYDNPTYGYAYERFVDTPRGVFIKELMETG